MKQTWEGLFTFSNKVGAADQWLLAASVRLTALNNAHPDGPKAIDFLSRSGDVLAGEISDFLREQLEPLIVEARELSKGRKKSSSVSTSQLLLKQAEDMKAETLGLIQVIDAIKVCCSESKPDRINLVFNWTVFPF